MMIIMSFQLFLGCLMMVSARRIVRFLALLLLEFLKFVSDLALRVHRWLKKNVASD